MTPPARFLGMNIKGTPSMRASKVRHDLRVLQTKASVGAVQEFKWPWYWRVVGTLRDTAVKQDVWRTYPGLVRARLRPDYAAQAIMWRQRRWKRVRGITMLLHGNQPGISGPRWMRALLLQDRRSGLDALRCWFVTTHFVVGGDQDHHPLQRRAILRGDIGRLHKLLTRLEQTRHPIVMQLDANIRPGGWAYGEFRRIIGEHDGRIIGEHGVEYTVVFDGSGVAVDVMRAWRIPADQLNTDHEGRGITFTLEG